MRFGVRRSVLIQSYTIQMTSTAEMTQAAKQIMFHMGHPWRAGSPNFSAITWRYSLSEARKRKTKYASTTRHDAQ